MSVVPLPMQSSSQPSGKNKRKSIHKPPPSFFGVVLQALNPNSCIRACHGDVEQVLEDEFVLGNVLPDILDTIGGEGGDDEQLVALGDFHRLVDKTHAQNRIPIVCTHKWDAIKVLATYISRTNSSKGRRQACLILNNLSIPFDNKAAIILGQNHRLLLTSILDIIRRGCAEAYLCCVCLMNLSILEDAKDAMIKFIPSGGVAKGRAALDNPLSLISTLEKMMEEYRPFLLSTVVSAEGEAIRWTVGMFRNLCTNAETAALLALTSIPSVVAGFLRDSPHLLCKWKRDSLEDLTLALLVQLVQYQASLKIMQRQHKNITASLKQIADEKGIHGMRALMISNHLAATN